MIDEDTMGPIDYLIVEFPPDGPRGRALPVLTEAEFEEQKARILGSA
ncbi:MAG TPA: hypothetical protein VL738_19405 [Dactylosporangium sp.]|jgi:hypothetical protein|nr:hypothetical protein [Dactylosporangium sp.]